MSLGPWRVDSTLMLILMIVSVESKALFSDSQQ